MGIKDEIEFLGKFSHFDPPSNHVVAVFKMEYGRETLDIDLDEMMSGEFFL